MFFFGHKISLDLVGTVCVYVCAFENLVHWTRTTNVNFCNEKPSHLTLVSIKNLMANWVWNRISIHVERKKEHRYSIQCIQFQQKRCPKTICFQPNFLCMFFFSSCNSTKLLNSFVFVYLCRFGVELSYCINLMPSDRIHYQKKENHRKREKKHTLEEWRNQIEMSLSSSLKPIYPVACAVGHRLFGSLNAVLKRRKKHFETSSMAHYAHII